MRSVFELGARDLVSRLETKNSMTCSKLGDSLNREVKEESFLVYVLVCSIVLVKYYWRVPFIFGFLGGD